VLTRDGTRARVTRGYVGGQGFGQFSRMTDVLAVVVTTSRRNKEGGAHKRILPRKEGGGKEKE